MFDIIKISCILNFKGCTTNFNQSEICRTPTNTNSSFSINELQLLISTPQYFFITSS